jgi:hypothetical protein
MSHEPSTPILLNGCLLGYLPVRDWVYAWVSTRFAVPPAMLRPGHNVLAIRAGYSAPGSQDSTSRWDEVQIRGVYLAPAATGSSASQGDDSSPETCGTEPTGR